MPMKADTGRPPGMPEVVVINADLREKSTQELG